MYAVAGIAALWGARTAPPPVVWEQQFAMYPNQRDREVADRVVRLLGLSLATPVHDFAIGHDAQRHLVLDFYHANGRHKVTVLEPRGILRVEHTRASLWKYLSTLHVTTAAFHSGDWRMQLWAWWNEFAMWCLAVMSVSVCGSGGAAAGRADHFGVYIATPRWGPWRCWRCTRSAPCRWRTAPG